MGVPSEMNRREFAALGVAAAATAVLPGTSSAVESKKRGKNEICAFIKFVQDLNYDQLADMIAELGFDGIEATIRKKGYILPEHAADELPKLQEALDKRDLKIMIMTSDVLSPDTPHGESALKAAAAIGVPRYRMGFYRYDLKRPIMEQLNEIRPQVRDLAAMNKELGIGAVYQNHCGADFMGATLWDLREVIKDIPVEEVACVFDVRHAQVESGLAWPIIYDIMRPHISAVSVKDYAWRGAKVDHVPLGEGKLNTDFFELMRAADYQGPISLHVEYLKKEGTQANIDALRKDLGTLRGWLGHS